MHDGAVKNALDGDAAAEYIHRLAKTPYAEIPEMMRLAERLMKETLCHSRMTIGITATDTILPNRIIASFPKGTPVPEEREYRILTPTAAGFRIPALTGYAARGYRLSKAGLQFEGIMWLATSILTLEYMWNLIRVQGGVYDTGIQVDRSGNVYSWSYRDPAPAKTLEADGGAAAYLREFAARTENLDQYIISALNELNLLLSSRDKGSLADARYLSGYTQEDAERLRKQILNAVPADLVRCAEWLEPFSREGAICVIAHRDALKECAGLSIRDL